MARSKREMRHEISEEVPFSAGLQAGVIPMLPVVPRAKGSATRNRRWAVILAGGDGTRLRSLTRFICGDDRPKQFCPVFGERTLLEQTRQRAIKSIPAAQTIFAVTRAHEDYYLRDLGYAPCHRLVQPCNKGTAPPILYSLLQIAQTDPNATVAILPCDHYYSDEDAFTRALESAFQTVTVRPRSVVLMGAKPNAPEVEYGWIQIGSTVGERLFQVRGFREKPPLPMAQRLLRTGALWNTLVMVGNIDAFLDMAWVSLPGLLEIFQTAIYGSHGNRETRIPDSLYDWVCPTDFSRQVLSPGAKRLVTLRLEDMEWNDLGHPDRVFSTLLNRNAELPAWARSWHAAENAGSSAPSALS